MPPAALRAACALLLFIGVSAAAPSPSSKGACVTAASGVGSHRFPQLRSPFAPAPVSASVEDSTQPANVLDHRLGVAFVRRNRTAASAACPRGTALVHRLLCCDTGTAEGAAGGTTAAADTERGLLRAAGEGAEAAECFRVETACAAEACAVEDRAEACSSNQLPLPTADQQRYQRHEIMGVRAHARGWKRALGAPPMPSRHCPACSIRSAVWDLTYKPRPSRPHPHS